jgi:hypothetical protein
MKRAEFDHAIRAAGSILGESEILVIGSQAIHGSISGDLPAEAERSVEVDIVAFDDANARKADLIDGSIGEASTFHETFGYYAEGVSETTAVLPDGWRERLVRYESPMTNGVVGHSKPSSGRRCGGLFKVRRSRPAPHDVPAVR